MNRIILLFANFFIICISSSCCTKKQCSGVEEINSMELKYFNEQDLQLITIETYEKNTNFSNRTDSSVVTYVSGFTNLKTIYLNSAIDKNYDYKLSLPNTGLEYKLTDFRIRKEHCNICFPFHPSGDNYDILEKYSVNGLVQTGETIVIRK